MQTTNTEPCMWAEPQTVATWTVDGLRSITPPDCLHIRDLTITGPIDSLEGIQALVHLERLVCSSKSLTCIEPLSTLIQLRELILSGCAVSSLEPLNDCVELVILDISHNFCITSLAALGPKPRLTYLKCQFNSISSLAGLESCPSLEYLN